MSGKKLVNFCSPWMVFVWLLLILPASIFALENTDKKSQLTAAFLYQITKFVHWPEPIPSEYKQLSSICILGQPGAELHQYLIDLEAKSTHGRNIEIVHLENKQDLFVRTDNNCEILFSANGEWETLTEQEIDQHTQTTLSIGTSKQFLHNGGMLALVVIDNKMKIFINSANIENTQIKLESRLKPKFRS